MVKPILLVSFLIISSIVIPNIIAQTEDTTFQSTTPSVSYTLSYNSDNFEMTFHWGVVEGSTGYKIFDYTIWNGIGALLITLPGDATGWVKTGVPTHSFFCYTLTRLYSGGKESWNTCLNTTPDTGTPPPPPPSIPPNAPLNLEATIEGSNFDTIRLVWDAPDTTSTASVSGYNIFRSTDPNVGFSSLTNITDSSIQVWEDIPALRSDVYYYRVYTNSSDAGLSTNYASVSAGGSTAPLNFEAVAGSNTIQLSWSFPNYDGKSSIIAYRLYSSSNLSEPFQVIADLTVPLYIDTNISPGQNYYYKVSAVNRFGTGKNASVSLIGVVLPALPNSFTTRAKDKQVELLWDNPNDDSGFTITGYEIYRSVNLQERFELIASIPSTQATMQNYTDDELANGQTYYYLLYSVNSFGASNSYLTQVATPATIPDVPNSLKATSESTQVTLSWAVPTDNGGSKITEYLIYRSKNLANFQRIGLTNSLSYIDDTIIAEGFYKYRVSTKNAHGESSSFASIDVSLEGVITTANSTTQTSPISTISFNISNIISNTESPLNSSNASSNLPASETNPASVLIFGILSVFLLQIAYVILIQLKKKRPNHES